MSAKFRRKFETPEAAKPRKGGWTDQEVNNLVEMANRGIPSGEIARKLEKKAEAVYTKISNLKKAGRITGKPKNTEPEETEDGFKSL